MRYALAITLALLAITGGCYKPKSEGQPLGSKDNPLIMAFVPSTEAEKVLSSGDELIKALNAQTGLTYKPMMASSYEGVVAAMGAGKVHVAWLPPMAYLLAHERDGGQVILKVVRNGKPTYRGQIVVMANSPIKTLLQLKGKRLAFVDPTSASGHLYPRALLLENGIDPDKDLTCSFANSHDAALIALVKGSVDAACSYDDARSKLKKAMPDIMQQTRILAYTPEIPADNVAVIKGLDPALVKKTTDGLIALAADEKGKQILMDLYEVEGLVPALDSDYEPVRKMAQALKLNIEEEVKKSK